MEIWRNMSNSLPICLYVNVWCFRLSSECTWPNSVSRSWSDNCGRLWRFSVLCEVGKPDGNTSLPSTRWYLYRAGTRELEYADSKAVFIVTKHEVGKNSPFLFLNVLLFYCFKGSNLNMKSIDDERKNYDILSCTWFWYS